MWCFWRMQKSWTDRVGNEEMLHSAEERNILYTVQRRKANWIGNVVRSNCLLKQVIEGKVEGRMKVTWRRGSRFKQLHVDLQEKWGYCRLKEEALDRAVWRSRSASGSGLDVRQATEWRDLSISIQYIEVYFVGFNVCVRAFRVEFVDLGAVTVRERLATECQQTSGVMWWGPHPYLLGIILN